MEQTFETNDTVYAIASGMGRSAVAIIRVSGPACRAILDGLCPRTHFVERRATVARVLDRDGNLIDQGIVLYFCAPRSFTGEDLIEFQVTGSRAVVAILLRTLSTFPACRPAEAGEFTRRSFENGKRDLAEAEGLAAVVEAETAAQLRNAQRAASGALSQECNKIRDGLLHALSILESFLDFSDIEDPDATSLADVTNSIVQLKASAAKLLRGSAELGPLRDGLLIVISGPPNAGKSTLMNLLTRREVSIVSSTPGTTRDLIETTIDIGGFPIVLVDTAGIRDPQDAVEAEGITRAFRRRQSADLTLLLSSCLEENDALEETPPATEVFRIKTKRDLAAVGYQSADIMISAKTGEGIDALVAKITNFASTRLATAADSLISTERQRAAMSDVISALCRYLANQGAALELQIEELRVAARCIGRIVGRIDVEEVLGSIFSRLCVGK